MVSISSPFRRSKEAKGGGEKMETMQQLFRRTIREGAPVYNQGDHEGCAMMYLSAAEHAVAFTDSSSFLAIALKEAIQEATRLLKQNRATDAAWALRRTFDDLLEIRDEEPAAAGAKFTSAIGGLQDQKSFAHQNLAALSTPPTPAGKGRISIVRQEEDSSEEWQDEYEDNFISDLEKAQHLAHIYAILLTGAHLTTHTVDGKEYRQTCPTTEISQVMVDFGLAKHRRAAVEKLHMLQEASFLELTAVPDPNREGSKLYMFPTNDVLEAKYQELLKTKPHAAGSKDAVTFLALKEFLEIDDADDDDDTRESFEMPKLSRPLSVHHLKLKETMAMQDHDDDPELIARGIQLAVVMAQIEPLLQIQDRRHGVKTYEQCFVGTDAVTTLVDTKKLFTTRAKATSLLNKLLQVGFLEHVTKDHEFKDKKYFYVVVPRSKLQTKLDNVHKKASSQNHINDDVVAENALAERLKHFSKLGVAEILNSFFGCGHGDDMSKMNTECWDVVDLQTWRNNMKRWGFGRRTDQDDEMVDKLSPLALAVDPDTWKMEEQDEEWRTPWGILAQIAIFDQVPRSAFRGTADAFKWDDLAIKATQYAVEQGYFETAYKSTLNRFVLLLPLEHSESWDDQKQGVNLLLQMLSTVAIEDEGHSDYEIVKRLEFSKRLTTAFLEHAQVVAKFKRFPHRNKAHGRGTSIEERIWLASDLVPRWAKSQQHTDEEQAQGGGEKRNLLRIPVIPLKSLTRK